MFLIHHLANGRYSKTFKKNKQIDNCTGTYIGDCNYSFNEPDALIAFLYRLKFEKANVVYRYIIEPNF